MKIDQAGIDEVHKLCGVLADDSITDAQCARLKELLKTSADAREIYFHSVSLSDSLAEYANETQSELSSDTPTRSVAKSVHPARYRTWAVGVVAAACIMLSFVAWQYSPRRNDSKVEIAEVDVVEGELESGVLVARITGSKDCVWADASYLDVGAAIQFGEQLDLESGLAEVTFDSGARLVLEGPALLEVDSGWEATLHHGGLRATVPPQAIGFAVHHKSVEVVDLGTEFSMVADADGNAEVHVLTGSVEVSAVSEKENATVVMEEDETLRFGGSRDADQSDFEQRHASLAISPSLDRWGPPVNLVHWSFDKLQNGFFMGESDSLEGNFRCKSADVALTDSSLIAGRWEKAMHFDGSFGLSTAMPQMPESGSRTLAFWVRMPQDGVSTSGQSGLASGQVLGTWPLQGKKSARLLRVGWNRNLNQGPLGVLRTEFAKVNAVGTTPLRDSEWHHVALVLVSRGRKGRLHLTQYVDGRLEGATTRTIKSRRIALQDNPRARVWLGRSPKQENASQNYFLGDMDELYIADRALTPSEIVLLMTQNTLQE